MLCSTSSYAAEKIVDLILCDLQVKQLQDQMKIIVIKTDQQGRPVSSLRNDLYNLSSIRLGKKILGK